MRVVERLSPGFVGGDRFNGYSGGSVGEGRCNGDRMWFSPAFPFRASGGGLVSRGCRVDERTSGTVENVHE